ncbi:MAG: hypothetical protein Q9165_005948 [Trypethelium subeluteriae]
MFGLILPHRPVLTPPTQISDTQLAFPAIPATPPFSHLVVFLLPGTTLPPATGVAIYIQLPSSPAGDFKLLGAIGPGRESAIFKVNLGSSSSGVSVANGGAGGAVGSTLGAIDEDAMVDDGGAAPNAAAAPTAAGDAGLVGGGAGAGTGTLTVGLSIEPAANIEAQLASLKTANPSTSGFNPSSAGALVRQRTTTNVAPGASSAVVGTKVLAQRIIGNAFNFLASFAGNTVAGEEVVPLKAFRDWWAKFEKRIELDPGFLEREESG